MSQMSLSCPDCGDERLFGQYHDAPGGCPDSPDGDCPEWFCTACGAALLAGFVLAGPPSSRAAGPAPALEIRSNVA